MKSSFKCFTKVSVVLVFLSATAAQAAIPEKIIQRVPSQTASGRSAMRDGILLNAHFQSALDGGVGTAKDLSREIAASVSPNADRENAKWQIDTRIIADTQNKEWVRVGETVSGLVILAYVQPLDGEQVKIHLRLIDVSKGDERLVASPAMVTTYGAKAVVRQQETSSDKGFSIEVTPSRVRY